MPAGAGSTLRVPTGRELRDVARLAAPLVAVQVGLMAMGVVDAAMLGRVSPAAMAGAALGNFYWLIVVMVGHGLLQALDPLVAQAVGALDAAAIRRGVQRGLVLASVLAVFAVPLLLPATEVLLALGQPPEVARLAGAYSRASIPGVLPFFAFIAVRQSLQAFGRVRPILGAIVAANVFNAFFDWVLIFGHLGFDAAGVVGSARATAASRWVMFVLLLGAGWPLLGMHLRASWRAAVRPGALAAVVRIGLPIGIHQWLEIAAFGGALILMGRFGTLALAAHQIAVSLAALTYMVPLGTGAAAAVLVGHAIGRSDPDGARREASAALVLGVGFMGCAGVVLVLVPGLLARSFTAEPDVLALAVTLIPIAGIFQVFDGVQGVSSGILRGAGDTRVPMLINLAGFGVVGLPAAWFLAARTPLGPPGIWWGLVAALVVVAALLAWRVRSRMSGALHRVEPATSRPAGAIG